MESSECLDHLVKHRFSRNQRNRSFIELSAAASSFRFPLGTYRERLVEIPTFRELLRKKITVLPRPIQQINSKLLSARTHRTTLLAIVNLSRLVSLANTRITGVVARPATPHPHGYTVAARAIR